MAVAQAAIDAREFERVREVLKPLVAPADGSRPSERVCRLMAELEEAGHGETGALFEWLQRAARAPRDPAWVADGVVAEHWSPVSPVTGRLDAFEWIVPQDRMRLPDAVEASRVRVPAVRDGGDAPTEAEGAAEATTPVMIDHEPHREDAAAH